MADFVSKVGDRGIDFELILKDVTGPIDLTGGTVIWSMWPWNDFATKKVNNQSMTIDPDQSTNTGRVSYAWTANDVDTAGWYLAEVKLTSGGIETRWPRADGDRRYYTLYFGASNT